MGEAKSSLLLTRLLRKSHYNIYTNHLPLSPYHNYISNMYILLDRPTSWIAPNAVMPEHTWYIYILATFLNP